ncbi:MAG TPA: MMPL family transporter [Gaiellaceae bacterium]|nr:MMPL family transporter [Gaiellaceae bacterium]
MHGGRASRAYAAALVFLRFLVPPLVAVAAFVVWHAGPSISSLPSANVGALLPGGLPATEAEAKSARIFGSSLLPRILVVQRDPGGISLRSQRAIVRHAIALDRGTLTGYPKGSLAAPYVNTLRIFPAARERSTTAITYLAFPGDVKATTQRDLAARYADQVSRLGPQARVTGFIVGNLEQSQSIDSHLRWVELATILVIAIILGLYLRSVAAPLVTLAAAGIAWLLSTRAVAYLGVRTGISLQQEVEPIVAVLLLGVVTDYSVFFLAGTRARLLAGDSRKLAARMTVAQFIPIVFTAGWLVALGLTTLRVASIGFVQALGPAMAIVVLTSMLVSVTFVPAVIAVFGRLLFWPGLRQPRSATGRRLRTRVVSLLTRKWIAAPAILLLVAALVAAGTGIAGTRLGLTPIAGLPGGSPAVIAAHDAQTGFAAGIVSPSEIVLQGHGVADDSVALAALSRLIDHVPGVAAVIGAGETAPFPRLRPYFRSPTRHAARYLVVLEDEPYGPQAIDDLNRVEAAMPQLLADVGLGGASASYAGDTAIAAESVDRIRHDIAWVALAAFLVNLVLLAIFLRALVAPLLLILASALALAATFGITTYVFQDLLGYDGLTYYVPLAVGVLLLSLGSDYNLFVVGRVWQESEGRSVARAIRAAAPRASRAISIAGVALALSFATLSIVPLRPFREFAFAMAIGVLIDTFVVRSYLIPSLIALFGHWTWWPSSRGRPRLHPARPHLERGD